ncbi:hypothetical protein KUTeg_012670 [Tegillarca granosa]|uniref:Hcy-binding domain-containing protein n=1 Tax=Tegillarca granosa TaxID=220873 RepID=A0ABQ9F054_TEGGR|nr:hypothetical protein KUTeg_012670 [Tegillarca granosa]
MPLFSIGNTQGVSNYIFIQRPIMVGKTPAYQSIRYKTGTQKKRPTNFLDSGSEVVVTASYQASVDGFCKHAKVTEEKAIELIKLSVELAREVCNEVTAQSGIKRLVAGSVGPYGAALHDGSEYNGKYTETLSKQTIPAQKEAEAVLELLKEFPVAKAWVTFSCGSKDSTFHGEKLDDAIKAVLGSENLVAVGVNCTSPGLISPLLKSGMVDQIPHSSVTLFWNGTTLVLHGSADVVVFFHLI